MQTIQVVLEEELLSAADVAAKQQKMNRSALIRHALRDHLQRLNVRRLEEMDSLGYLAKPQREDEFRSWEDIASWPEP